MFVVSQAKHHCSHENEEQFFKTLGWNMYTVACMISKIRSKVLEVGFFFFLISCVTLAQDRDEWEREANQILVPRLWS